MTQVGAEQFTEVLQHVRGTEAVAEWRRLQDYMRPLAAAATALPPIAFRQDWGVLRTALLRYAPHLLASGGAALQLTGPFSKASPGPAACGWRSCLATALLPTPCRPPASAPRRC